MVATRERPRSPTQAPQAPTPLEEQIPDLKQSPMPVARELTGTEKQLAARSAMTHARGHLKNERFDDAVSRLTGGVNFREGMEARLEELTEPREQDRYANYLATALKESARQTGNTQRYEQMVELGLAVEKSGNGALGTYIQSVGLAGQKQYGESVAAGNRAANAAAEKGDKKLEAVACGQLARSLEEQAKTQGKTADAGRVGALHRRATGAQGDAENSVLQHNYSMFLSRQGRTDEARQRAQAAVENLDKRYHSTQTRENINGNYDRLHGTKTPAPSEGSAAPVAVASPPAEDLHTQTPAPKQPQQREQAPGQQTPKSRTPMTRAEIREFNRVYSRHLNNTYGVDVEAERDVFQMGRQVFGGQREEDQVGEIYVQGVNQNGQKTGYFEIQPDELKFSRTPDNKPAFDVRGRRYTGEGDQYVYGTTRFTADGVYFMAEPEPDTTPPIQQTPTEKTKTTTQQPTQQTPAQPTQNEQKPAQQQTAPPEKQKTPTEQQKTPTSEQKPAQPTPAQQTEQRSSTQQPATEQQKPAQPTTEQEARQGQGGEIDFETLLRGRAKKAVPVPREDKGVDYVSAEVSDEGKALIEAVQSIDYMRFDTMRSGKGFGEGDLEFAQIPLEEALKRQLGEGERYESYMQQNIKPIVDGCEGKPPEEQIAHLRTGLLDMLKKEGIEEIPADKIMGKTGKFKTGEITSEEGDFNSTWTQAKTTAKGYDPKKPQVVLGVLGSGFVQRRQIGSEEHTLLVEPAKTTIGNPEHLQQTPAQPTQNEQKPAQQQTPPEKQKTPTSEQKPAQPTPAQQTEQRSSTQQSKPATEQQPTQQPAQPTTEQKPQPATEQQKPAQQTPQTSENMSRFRELDRKLGSYTARKKAEAQENLESGDTLHARDNLSLAHQAFEIAYPDEQERTMRMADLARKHREKTSEVQKAHPEKDSETQAIRASNALFREGELNARERTAFQQVIDAEMQRQQEFYERRENEGMQVRGRPIEGGMFSEYVRKASTEVNNSQQKGTGERRNQSTPKRQETPQTHTSQGAGKQSQRQLTKMTLSEKGFVATYSDGSKQIVNDLNDEKTRSLVQGLRQDIESIQQSATATVEQSQTIVYKSGERAVVVNGEKAINVFNEAMKQETS